jgi:hypothetical protein
MADPYADIARADSEVQQRLAEALEIRAGERRQREMLAAYLTAVSFPPKLACWMSAVERAPWHACCPNGLGSAR